MSASFPVMLINGGSLTAEEGRPPVYIDAKGTHHFIPRDLVKKIFNSSAQLQMCEKVLEESSQFNALLIDENLLLRQELSRLSECAQKSFEDGMKFQESINEENSQRKGNIAYHQGRMDQRQEQLQSIGDVFKKYSTRFEKELTEFKEKSQSSLEMFDHKLEMSSKQLQRCREKLQLTFSQTVADDESKKNRKTDPDDQNREQISDIEVIKEDPLPVLVVTDDEVKEDSITNPDDQNREETSDADVRKEDPLPILVVTGNDRIAKVVSEKEDRIGEKTDRDIDSSKSFSEGKCDDLSLEKQYAANPARLKDDLTATLIAFCKNLKKGYPELEKMLHVFYNFPPKFDIATHLKFKIKKNQKPLLKAIRIASSSRGKCPSFREFLGLILKNLDDKNNKIKNFIRLRRNNLYSFEECLKEGEIALAVYKVQQMIKGYKIDIDENGVNLTDYSEIVSAIDLLARNPETILTANNCIIGFLKKDPSLFVYFTETISFLYEECLKNRQDKVDEFLINFLNVGINKNIIANLLGKNLAKQYNKKQIGSYFVFPSLLTFWGNHYKDSDCFEAFWNYIPSCSWKNNPEFFQICIDGILGQWMDDKGPDNISTDKLILALSHLCRGCSENASFYKNSSVGMILMSWWNLVSVQASPEQRKDFVLNIGNVIARDLKKPSQYIMYLSGLWNEFFREELNDKRISADFILKLFIQININTLCDNAIIRDKLADLSWNFWTKIPFLRSDIISLYNPKVADKLYNLFSKTLKGSYLEERLEEVRQMHFQRVLFVKYRICKNNAFDCFSPSLPSSFSKKFDIQIRDYLNHTQHPISMELSTARLLAKAKIIFAKMLLKELWSDRFEEAEKSLREFYLEEVEKCQADQEVQRSLKKFFLTMYDPKSVLKEFIQKAKAIVTDELSPDFWKKIQDKSEILLTKVDYLHDYYLHYNWWAMSVKNIFLEAFQKEWSPINKNKFFQMIKVADSISSPYEAVYKNIEVIQPLVHQEFFLFFSSAINADNESWKFLAENCLSTIPGNKFFEFVDFALKDKVVNFEKLLEVIIYCIQYNKDNTMEKLMNYCIKKSSDINHLSSLLNDVGRVVAELKGNQHGWDYLKKHKCYFVKKDLNDFKSFLNNPTSTERK